MTRTKQSRTVNVTLKSGHVARVCPKVGNIILIDDRRFAETLHEGDDYFDESYPGCDFRIWSYALNHSIGCNVQVTGRTAQVRGMELMVRARIEFVGDGEDSTFVSGWLYLSNNFEIVG